MNQLTFQNVWEMPSDELTSKLIQFWTTNNALGDEREMRKRARQVVWVALDGQSIAGVCTAQRMKSLQLKNWFWFYRVFVGENYRRNQLATTLTQKTIDFFEGRFLAGKDSDIIGVFAIVQSAVFKKYRNLGVSRTGLVYIGDNENGDHMRVYYFKDARINNDHLG